MAANAPDLLKSFLKDIELEGIAVIPKRKLLWLLGWGQDREDTWKDLLDYWNEVASKPVDLYFLEIDDKVALFTKPRAEIVTIQSKVRSQKNK